MCSPPVRLLVLPICLLVLPKYTRTKDAKLFVTVSAAARAIDRENFQRLVKGY